MLRRALVVIGNAQRIELGDLPRAVRATLADDGDADEILAAAERRHIVTMLQRHGSNRGVTAQALGIGERTLPRRLEDYGLAPHRR